jgi:hypothetical protein
MSPLGWVNSKYGAGGYGSAYVAPRKLSFLEKKKASSVAAAISAREPKPTVMIFLSI